MRKIVAVTALVLWEAWWGYQYVSAPVPDEAMQSVAAVPFGGGTLVVGALLFAGYIAMRRLPRL
jgi:hypothetical protein